VPVIDRADRPADDETRVEIQDVGEIQLTALADHELGGVADPSLIRRGCRELAVRIRRDRQVVGAFALSPSLSRRRHFLLIGAHHTTG
jgi:hypothetical protein